METPDGVSEIMEGLETEPLSSIRVKQKKDGNMVFENNWRYEGSLDSNNLPNGYGLLHMINGVTYRGEFLGGNFNGEGELIRFGKVIFKGNWKENKKEGKGYEISKDGNIYNGNYKDGKKHGYGNLRSF